MIPAAVEISDHALRRFEVRFAEVFGEPPPDPETELRSILRAAVPATRRRAILALIRYKRPAAYFVSDGWGIVTDEARTVLITIYRIGDNRDRWAPIPRVPRRRAGRRRR